MNLDDRAESRDLILAAGAAACAAIAFVVLLGALAVPKDFKARLAELDAGVEAAQRLARPVRDAQVLPAGAVCAGAGQGAPALAAAMREAAGQAQLQAVRVQVSADAGPPARGGLKPLRIRVEATGPYESVVQMLDVIGRQQPQVYADTADLTAKAQAVTLSFSGRAFCAS